MTKTEFKLLEKICKKCWKHLAETGSHYKPNYMMIFKGSCPACEIAESCRNNVLPCKECCPSPDLAKNSCSIFYKWLRSEDYIERQKIAVKIASYKWEWRNIYKTTKLYPEIKEFIKENKITFKENKYEER